MICQKCGAQNMDGVTFCGSCGAQLASRVSFAPEAPIQNVQNNMMLPPKNWMTEAVIATIVTFVCCCSPISVILGIIAIVKANNVNSEFARGNFEEANRNAQSAKNLTMWAAIVAVIFYVLFAILYFVFFAAVISQAGGLTEFLNSLN